MYKISFSKNSRKTAFQRIVDKRGVCRNGLSRLDAWIRGNSWKKKRTWNESKMPYRSPSERQ